MLKIRERSNWRASLVPAAAVIPAPVAYTKVVAVKKLVVGFLWRLDGLFAMNRISHILPHLAMNCPGLS